MIASALARALRRPFASSSRERRRLVPPPPLCARDEPAYALLETARLICERLRARDGEERAVPEPRLAELHRELGLAGYFASERIPSQQRRAVLEHAHGRAHALAGPRGDWAVLSALIVEAEAAVLGALHVPGLSDHMQQAHERLAAARALLDAQADRSGAERKSTGSRTEPESDRCRADRTSAQPAMTMRPASARAYRHPRASA